MPAYEEIANEFEMHIVSLSEEYKKLITKMSQQREEIHREVDTSFNQMEEDVDEIKEQHHNILKKDLDEIKQFQSLMQQTLLALIEIDEFNKVTQTIHYSSKNEKFRKLPPKVNVSMPRYIPKPIEKEDLHGLIGKLTTLHYHTGGESLTSKDIECYSRRIIE